MRWRPAASTRVRPPATRGRGGLYELSYHNYADRDDTYSFDRLDAEVVQHIPILRENWVISLHGLLQTTLDDADTVPYFLMPSLGSGSTLRAYSSWRFRDRHSMLMSAEWRWIPNRLGLDMALFYDTGKVTPRFRDISWNGLAERRGRSASVFTARSRRRCASSWPRGARGCTWCSPAARHSEQRNQERRS